jgi:hypothetical protein
MFQQPGFATVQSLVQRIESLTGLPRPTLIAIALLVFGWLVALSLRRVAERIVERAGRLLPSADSASPAERKRARVLVGRAVFWTVMLGFLMSATELLGLPLVTTWVNGIAAWLPKLLVAIVVLVAGIALGRLVRRAVAQGAQGAGISYSARLGGLAQIAVVGATVLVAAEQLGVEVSFVTSVLMIVLACLLGGAALAFGLGSRGVVENILSGHYVRQLYQVGHLVRIDGVEGRVLRLTPTAVVLSTDDGEVVVPAQEFTRVRSMRVSERGTA